MDAARRAGVVVRAQLAAWRGQARRIRARSGRTITSVLLVVAGLAGALGGGALVGRWCLGLVLIAESAGAVWVGLCRDDGQPTAVRGARTVAEVLEQHRHLP
jgi:hypothetical protein